MPPQHLLVLALNRLDWEVQEDYIGVLDSGQLADEMHDVCNKIILIAYDMHVLCMGIRCLYRTWMLLVGRYEEAYTARRGRGVVSLKVPWSSQTCRGSLKSTIQALKSALRVGVGLVAR